MLRSLTASLALVLFASLSTPALAVQDTIGGNRSGACPSAPDESVLATSPGEPVSSPAEVTTERAPDPVRAFPGADSPEVDFSIVSESVQTYTEGGLTHTIRTTLRHGIPRGMRAETSSGGGRLASLMSGVCSFLGRNVIDRQHMICGGGCLTQYMRRTADAYSNDADLVNTYWDRIEVRLWWARDSTNIYLTGNAYTEWREPGRDCNNVDQSRVTSNSFAPAWFTWDRTYDYYWDETWLPTMAAPGNFTLYVFTDTPESFGPTLHTEIFLQ